MTKWTRFVLAGAGLWAALAFADAALAQDNFDAGKTGAQLYAADCAICHKSAQSLNRNVGGPFGGVESFLREHYTASREAAAAITAYLNSVGGSPAAADRKPAKGKRKADDKKKDAKPAKTEEKKEKKPEEKSGDKPAEKPADKKSDKDKKDSGQAAHPKSAAIARATARG
jgi:mono/diheme cytochrome c family protein